MTSIDLLKPLRRRRSRLERLAGRIRALTWEHDELERTIADHKAIQPEIEQAMIDNLQVAATSLAKEIADQKVTKANLKRCIQNANAARVGRLLVWKYFTAEQRRIRSESSSLAAELSGAKQHLSKCKRALSQVCAEISAIWKRISDHESFDLNGAEKRFSSLGSEIELLKVRYAADNAELVRIETKIRPHTKELDRLKSELVTLNADIARANRFEQELSSASNSYERAIIHKECEEKFETGSPKQVINDCRKKIRNLENNIPKLERRVRDELQKLERTIGHLLIDGNNACYEGQYFIGLRAISALLREISGRYKTTVVFDASIRAMLKTDTQGVEHALGTSVNMHVAPTKTAADEYLLKLADQDNSAYIMSNDRFAEYHDYDAVKSGRVFRFLIAEGKLMANDIDISVDF